MIFLVLVYVAFLAAYLPFNFYVAYRIHEMRFSRDHTSAAMVMLAVGIALIVFVSLITIAAFDWPTQFSIFR